MKKGIIFILLIIFLVSVGTSSVSAISPFGRILGGRIIALKALEIAELEATGWICTVPGVSIEILPIGSPSRTPTSYFIPPYTTSKTGTIPRAGQLIMGKYFGRTPITCIYPSKPPLIRVVFLNTITLFGTSR